MMNINDEDVNLGVALSSTNYSIRTQLKNSSGAGVNADSRMDLAFAASDHPLSELVWSPHNGLSLKCANSSAADKKPFLLWNVGPSDNGPSRSHIFRLKGSRDDNAVDQENFTVSQTMLDADDIFVDKATLLKPLESCHTPELGPSHRDCDDNLQPQEEPDDEVTSATGAVNKNNRNVPISIPAPPSKKLESAAENELCHRTEKDAYSLGGKKLLRENSVPVEGSQTNSRLSLCKLKGKEKALSDGDIYGRSSDDEDDNSHESVESCNSTGLFPKGIKRECYDKGAILGSKRMKKQSHGSHRSTSITRRDSSFMNWISNMVKGLSDTNKEDASSLALTFACSNDVYGKNPHENFICNRRRDSASLNMGFQLIFQSLYCRDTNILGTGVRKEKESIEESGELMVDDKKSLENLPGDRNHRSPCKQIVTCNREVKTTDCSPYLRESNLAENKASEILASDRAKNDVIPSDSLGEHMNSTAEKTSPDVSGKSNLCTSLWITRLSTKNPRSEKCKEIAQETIECSDSCPEFDLDSQMNAVFPTDQKSSETRDDSADSQVYASIKESQKLSANTEAFVDFKSKSKLCPILPSQKFKSSEAMASIFARRLDALRHIIPSEKRNSSTCSLTCFFCGGCHDLRECLYVTKSELEDLLVKMSSFDRVEESSCLCIRCSELDHWALSCPLAPSSQQWMSEQKASLVSQYAGCRLQLYAGDEKFLGVGEGRKLVAADHMDCSSRKPFFGSFPTFHTWNMQMCSSERVSTSNEMRRNTASNLANKVKDNQQSPLCDTVISQNTVALSEIFHAIRNLRLSRADILRWMNSNVSLSHLNGFFLRLRLGKLEAGLEGTSYYVARITGDAKEHNCCTSKKSILVDVGGIKSSVASQYVSNHDFLEDEIKAWWCRVVDSGCRIPSLDELNSKFNDRKSLGF